MGGDFGCMCAIATPGPVTCAHRRRRASTVFACARRLHAMLDVALHVRYRLSRAEPAARRAPPPVWYRLPLTTPVSKSNDRAADVRAQTAEVKAANA